MTAYKFLAADGLGVFSRFAWPLPDGRPGAWVESEVELCRAGIHACRPADLPYWLAPRAVRDRARRRAVDEQPLKVVAPRGRLIRRVDALGRPHARGVRADVLRARATSWSRPRPTARRLGARRPEIGLSESARLGFIAARIAEQLGGPDAHLEERKRQSDVARRAARARLTSAGSH